MTLEDPFYVVKDEVFKALNKTRGLYLRWQEVAAGATPPRSPQAEWTCTELKNALRSITWDLEDLEDTISIVEKNSAKFKIDNKEIMERRKFIDNTRKEVEAMQNRVRRGEWRARGEYRPAVQETPSPPTPEQWGAPQEQWGAPANLDTAPLLIPRACTAMPPPRRRHGRLFEIPSYLRRSLVGELEQTAMEELVALELPPASCKQDDLPDCNVMVEECGGEGRPATGVLLRTLTTARCAVGCLLLVLLVGLLLVMVY